MKKIVIPKWLPSKLVAWDGTVHGQDELALDWALCREFSTVGYDNDDGRLKVERVTALAVHVNTRLHAVDVEDIKDLEKNQFS